MRLRGDRHHLVGRLVGNDTLLKVEQEFGGGGACAVGCRLRNCHRGRGLATWTVFDGVRNGFDAGYSISSASRPGIPARLTANQAIRRLTV